jgi:hypothetical protein
VLSQPLCNVYKTYQYFVFLVESNEWKYLLLDWGRLIKPGLHYGFQSYRFATGVILLNFFVKIPAYYISTDLMSAKFVDQSQRIIP